MQLSVFFRYIFTYFRKKNKEKHLCIFYNYLYQIRYVLSDIYNKTALFESIFQAILRMIFIKNTIP